MSEEARPALLDPDSLGQALDRLSRVGQDITASLAFSDIFAAIERHVGALLDTATLYIGLLDESREWIDIPLFVDGGQHVPGRRLRVDDPVRPASRCVRENREILSEKTLEQALRDDIPGTNPTLTALFRPLVVRDRMIGVMSVQSARPQAYGERERLIFRALCSYAAVALANAESIRRLTAVEALEALGAVGQEITGSLQLDAILGTLERHLGKLFGAADFGLGLLDRDGKLIRFPLLADGMPAGPLPVDDPAAPAARALRDNQEVWTDEFETDPASPSITPRAATLHRPLSTRGRSLGVALLRLPHRDGSSERDTVVFRSLCAYLAIAVANARALEEAQEARAEATAALAELRRAQDSLITSEKMASLGGLVAGVAHEVNTPVGTALTVATTFERQVEAFRRKAEGAALRRSDLSDFVGTAGEAARQLTLNLMRASDLVGRFKEVAADRTSDERRPFRLSELVGAILTSLTSELRRHPHRLQVEVPAVIELDSYPGALGQILVNLVLNALAHAFPDGRTGAVEITAAPVGADGLRILVRDDGVGIRPADLPRIFDPFFTTRRSQGGTGLGLHIAFNLAAKTLGGHLACRSEDGHGAVFRLDIPLRAPAGPGTPNLVARREPPA